MDPFILMPLWHRVWGFHPPYIKQPGLTRIFPFPQPHPPPAAFVAAKAEEGRQRRSTTGPRRRRVDEAMSWWFSGSLVYGGLTACQQGDTVRICSDFCQFWETPHNPHSHRASVQFPVLPRWASWKFEALQGRPYSVRWENSTALACTQLFATQLPFLCRSKVKKRHNAGATHRPRVTVAKNTPQKRRSIPWKHQPFWPIFL